MIRPRAEVVNAFVSAVARVLRTSLGESATLAALEVSRRIDPAPSIAVTIELSGGLRGPVTWVFSPEMAHQVTARLLMTDEVPEDMVSDAVAELSNIVAGNATGPLSDAGYAVEITTPRIYAAAARPELSDDTLVATLSSASGTVRVFMNVEVAA